MAGKGGPRPGSGRPEGSKGKRTKEWESFAEYCLTGGLKKYREEMDKLSGKEYLSAFSTMLEYLAPKLARSEVDIKGQIDAIVISKTLITKKG